MYATQVTVVMGSCGPHNMHAAEVMRILWSWDHADLHICMLAANVMLTLQSWDHVDGGDASLHRIYSMQIWRTACSHITLFSTRS